MTNPIDPARLDHVKNKVEWWYGDRRELVRLILEADDRYRREHPPGMSIDEQTRLIELIHDAHRIGCVPYEQASKIFVFCRSIILAPAPHDAAKEANMNPTDAAGEEPVLPPHIKRYWNADTHEFIYSVESGGYDADGDKYYNVVDLRNLSPDDVRALADDIEYRQRLQDKREKETVVTDAMTDAAFEVFKANRPNADGKYDRNLMYWIVRAALEAAQKEKP